MHYYYFTKLVNKFLFFIIKFVDFIDAMTIIIKKQQNFLFIEAILKFIC